jgi:tetratricopeptide (TPR) repeat protein
MSRWRTTKLEAIPTIGAWIPVRKELDVKAFGVNAWMPDDKGVVIGEHDEKRLGHEEMYLVVEGHATFTIDGDEIDGPPGTLVFVGDPEVKRKATGTPETVVFSVGAKPGEAFTPSAWEGNAVGYEAYKEGDYERALELFKEGLDEFPNASGRYYNIACMLALLGRRDDAIENLRRAVEIDPDAYKPAEDGDFESLKDDPDFLAIAGQTDAARASA